MGNHRLPVIRNPNFSDLTWDIPLDRINLTVGNELGSPLYTVSLKEYLQNFETYLCAPSAQPVPSLLAPRDTHVVASSQACFLPIAAGTETEFNVALFNYQSQQGHPAVLTIVSTRSGTSAQVIQRDSSGTKLYFNQKGQRASFVGQRLKDNRIERGVAVEGAMSQQEKEQNVILILQVPLVQRLPPQRHKYKSYESSDDCDELAPPSGYGAPMPYPMASASFAAAAPPMSCMPQMEKQSRRAERSNVDEAIIKVGEASGVFSELQGCRIERDTRYPIRLTLQFYKATDNGVLNEENISAIATQIKVCMRLSWCAYVLVGLVCGV